MDAPYWSRARGVLRTHPHLNFYFTLFSMPRAARLSIPRPAANGNKGLGYRRWRWRSDMDTFAYLVKSINTWWQIMGMCPYQSAGVSSILLLCLHGQGMILGGRKNKIKNCWISPSTQLVFGKSLPLRYCVLPAGKGGWGLRGHREPSIITSLLAVIKCIKIWHGYLYPNLLSWVQSACPYMHQISAGSQRTDSDPCMAGFRKKDENFFHFGF